MALRSTGVNAPPRPGDTATSASRQRHLGAELHVDRAGREQRGLDGRRLRRVEAADAAPGDGERIGRGVDEDPAAGRRIEIGEERRHARRPAEEAREAAGRRHRVGLLERQVAVRVDEHRGERAPVVGERERDGLALRVVVGQRDAAAERGAERRRGLRHVVAAAAVALEAQAGVADVEAVARAAAACRRPRSPRCRRCPGSPRRAPARRDWLARAASALRHSRSATCRLSAARPRRPLPMTSSVSDGANGSPSARPGRARRRTGSARAARQRAGCSAAGSVGGVSSSPPPQATSVTSSRTGPNRRSGMWSVRIGRRSSILAAHLGRSSGNTLRKTARGPLQVAHDSDRPRHADRPA